jgi:hypothetical protein
VSGWGVKGHVEDSGTMTTGNDLPCSFKALQQVEYSHYHALLGNKENMWVVHGVSAANTNFSIPPLIPS